MSDTWAVQTETLAAANRCSSGGQPLCPACKNGRLHPYLVEISLSDHPGGWHGANYLTGWVAVCVGNGAANRYEAKVYRDAGEEPPEQYEHPACGFTMPMTPHRYRGRT